MTDTPPPTQDHIDLSDPASIQHWCQHFGVTEQQLDEAVKTTGPEPASVRDHLKRQGLQ